MAEFAASGAVVKADGESRFLLCVVYSPNRLPKRGADGYLDLVRPATLEKACWKFLDNGGRIGLNHQPGGEGAARVVENYVYRNKVPWVIKSPDGTKQVVRRGDWLVGLVLSPEAWQMFKAGKIGPVSLQGGARRRPATPKTLKKVGLA